MFAKKLKFFMTPSLKLKILKTLQKSKFRLMITCRILCTITPKMIENYKRTVHMYVDKPNACAAKL